MDGELRFLLSLRGELEGAAARSLQNGSPSRYSGRGDWRNNRLVISIFASLVVIGLVAVSAVLVGSGQEGTASDNPEPHAGLGVSMPGDNPFLGGVQLSLGDAESRAGFRIPVPSESSTPYPIRSVWINDGAQSRGDIEVAVVYESGLVELVQEGQETRVSGTVGSETINPVQVGPLTGGAIDAGSTGISNVSFISGGVEVTILGTPYPEVLNLAEEIASSSRQASPG